MQKNLILLALSFVVFLPGCASNYVDESKHGKPTMMELHQLHVAGMYGNKIDTARNKFSKISDRSEADRIEFYDDLRLPNPEMTLVVFPKRNSDGSVQPQQNVKFSMYKEVHYKVGRY